MVERMLEMERGLLDGLILDVPSIVLIADNKTKRNTVPVWKALNKFDVIVVNEPWHAVMY